MIKIRNTVRRTLFIVFLLLLSFTYASDRKGDFILKIETGNGKAVCFTLNPNEETFLFIYDQKHNLIYESAINKLDVLKTISLEGYSAGIYYLEVGCKEKTAKHEIKIISKDLKKVKIEESVNESPSLRR